MQLACIVKFHYTFEDASNFSLSFYPSLSRLKNFRFFLSSAVSEYRSSARRGDKWIHKTGSWNAYLQFHRAASTATTRPPVFSITLLVSRNRHFSISICRKMADSRAGPVRTVMLASCVACADFRFSKEVDTFVKRKERKWRGRGVETRGWRGAVSYETWIRSSRRYNALLFNVGKSI